LAGIAFLVKTMHHKLHAGERVAESAAADVAAMLQEAVGHARALARGLQPVDTLPKGLSVALDRLAADTAELYSVRCHFRCPCPVEIADPSAATHLYRIVQECVRAAVHYAKAKSINISLIRKQGGIELSVTDNATRPSPDHIFGGDMVRDMIHHRARVIGGRILIRRRKSGGVRVTCQIPDLKAA
jgi:signal transduction histidine kinase